MLQKCLLLLVVCAVYVTGDTDVPNNGSSAQATHSGAPLFAERQLELTTCYIDITEHIITGNKTNRICTNADKLQKKIEEYSEFWTNHTGYILPRNEPFLLYTMFLYKHKEAKEYFSCLNNTVGGIKRQANITRKIFKFPRIFNTRACKIFKSYAKNLSEAIQPGISDKCSDRMKQMDIEINNRFLDECKRLNVSSTVINVIYSSSAPSKISLIAIIAGSIILGTILICFITYYIIKKKRRNSEEGDLTAETKTP